MTFPLKVFILTEFMLYFYAVAVTVVAAAYLVNRDARMQRQLRKTISLSESGDAEAIISAQRIFALHWELTLSVGGILAYVSGKVWNDAIKKSFSQYKSQNTLQFALIATLIAIAMALLEASGITRRLMDAIVEMLSKGAMMISRLRQRQQENSAGSGDTPMEMELRPTSQFTNVLQ